MPKDEHIGSHASRKIAVTKTEEVDPYRWRFISWDASDSSGAHMAGVYTSHDYPKHHGFVVKTHTAATSNELNLKELNMLNWIITFFLLAVIAAVFGFGGLAGTFAEIAKFLAVVFVVLFVASLIYSAITGRKPSPPVL